MYVCIYIHTQIALTVTHNNANDRSTAIYTNNKYKLTNELQAKNNYKQFKHVSSRPVAFSPENNQEASLDQFQWHGILQPFPPP